MKTILVGDFNVIFDGKQSLRWKALIKKKHCSKTDKDERIFKLM